MLPAFATVGLRDRSIPVKLLYSYAASRNETLTFRKIIGMTNEQIENFLTPETFTKVVNINFRTRNSIQGMFLNANDFEDLKSKNLWRVITQSRMEEWNRTKNNALSRIYSGSDFTKLKV